MESRHKDALLDVRVPDSYFLLFFLPYLLIIFILQTYKTR
nr:MAG TPA: hypothetical protein [Caudoviricetes sp.]